MPLFSYKCIDCDAIIEKFLHTAKETLVCSCGKDMKRVLSNTHGRVSLNAYDNLQENILPEVDKIMERVANGSDTDFADISGE